MTYQQLLQAKRHSIQNMGIEPIWMPDTAFDYQAYVADHNIRKGREAGYIDTGLGKTFIEIILAVNYIRALNKPVLIICPLAVAFQFISEAEKFGIDDIEYSKDGRYTKKIVVCNYERLHHFNESDFECVICDESSILKNFDGATSGAITSFLRKIKYRFLYTATPSPNDYIELGTSSEALGYLGYTDMLTKFFTNNEDTISPQGIGVEWRLKGHAKESFFRWVASWSISMRMPSDLGFSNALHILPEMIMRDHLVTNDKPLASLLHTYKDKDGKKVEVFQQEMFARVAKTRKEMSGEARQTIEKRCELAAELAIPHDYTVHWCNLNPEADMLTKMTPGAVQISGSMKLEQKEEILLAFSKGEIKKLVTKPRITCFGLNWQHCNHTTFFPGFSHEQFYQAVRRFYRFGQKREVYVDRVTSEGQIRTIQALDIKAAKSDELYSMLNKNVNADFDSTRKQPTTSLILPSFLN